MLKKMQNFKWTLIIMLFLAFIVSIRLLWMGFLTNLDYPHQPLAQNGTLDLRSMEFNSKQTLQLNGEWEFSPNKFLKTDAQISGGNSEYQTVPGNWNSYMGNKSFNYGTYRLRILLDENQSYKSFGLKLNKINNASTIFINGEKVGSSGKIAPNEKEHIGTNVPYLVKFKPNSNEIDIVIQVSSNRINSGIVKPIRFGTVEAITQQNELSIGLQLLLCLVLLLHIAYGIILFFIRATPTKGLIYFTMLLLCAFISVLGSDDKLLFRAINVNYDLEVKVTYLSYIGVALFIPLIINQLVPANSKKWLFHSFLTYCVLYMLFVILAPTKYILFTSRVLFLAVLLFSVIVSTIKIKKANMNKNESIFLILACLSVGVNIMWATLKSNTTFELVHYPFDLIFSLLCFTAFWFQRFFRITVEAKQLAEKLQYENKRKDDFLINTSHELRNPLHGITNIAQGLINDERITIHEEHRDRLSTLINVSKRMSFMLNDLLDISRLKEGTLQIHPRKLHIQPVVDGVVDMIKFMADGKPIKMNVNIPDIFPEVKADETRLIQILFNLIHNAVKFTDEGSITIKATNDNDVAIIHVIDTGIGINEEDLNTIFEPYHQAEIHTHRASGGFGLGLSISKELVEMQKGNLSVKSIPGKGSIFSFSLPLYKNTQLSKEPESINIIKNTLAQLSVHTEENTKGQERNFLSRVKILAVDDDPINHKVLKGILDLDQHVIISAYDAQQALKFLERETFDLVITDVMMPKISGYELTRKIRDQFSISELPVLILTARARAEDTFAAFQVGANDYVTKPVDSWELKARVKALIDLKLSAQNQLRMEGAWLQSQIQPHFIFNTLNSIASLGMIDVDKMQVLLEEFSNYLRKSFDFNNAEPLIPLEHELSFVNSYLYIEQIRFGSRLSIEWEIDANMSTVIPPLSIQPLVENAIKHGILRLPKGGALQIRVKEGQDGTEVMVTDNGVGMSKEQINNLFQPTSKPINKGSGVGLQNVNRRLRQLYGMGLVIKSTAYEGTTVSFYIPK
ncbi:ATP-binding protein [Niallia taxi]|uniref:sensor histidine kinase n=1 Tax=Niallia taxi TaxID=2499688 RepID=UPI003982561C